MSPYSYQASTPEELSNILDAIIGPYEYEVLDTSPEAIKVIWDQICELQDPPIDTSYSFALHEEIYALNGVEYSCLWKMEESYEVLDPPIMMQIRTKRKKHWEQLELFPETTSK